MSHGFAGLRRVIVALTATAAACALGAPAARATPAQTAFALSGSNLLAFDPQTPATVQTIPITNVNAGETLVGIDVRPQNGMLYALGVNATANTATLYVVGRTGFAGVVGPAPGSIAFTTDGSTPVDLLDPTTVGYGFDVNPAADRIRVVAGTLNFRVNPNTGAGVDGDLGGASGSVVGTNPDGATGGATTTVDAAAYTNNRPNNGNVTTLYTLDAATNALYIQNPPNAGTQTAGATVTLGGSTLDFTAISGFDVDDAVNAPASSAPVATGSGYAALNVGGTTGLYAIDLTNGAATFIGNIGNGATAVQGLALQRDFDTAGYPVVALDNAATNVVRFSSLTPGTTTTQAVSGLAAGESLAAVALRPQTGQYYALGVDAAADTATPYLLDPQTGALTVVGIASQIAWVVSGGASLDLPDPATAGWGMDFNPTIDRLRIVTSTGINARVIPATGVAIDGNSGVAGVNTDLPINGSGATGVSATSYTNAFAQSLTGAATTQYTVAADTDTLYIQNPPNDGTQTLGLPLTLGGSPLDAATFAGVDIPGDVSVAASSARAIGDGIAALTVGGTTSIYRLELDTGKVASLGASSGGLRSIAVGDAQRDRPVLFASGPAMAFGARDVDDGPGAIMTTTMSSGSTTLVLAGVALVGPNSADFTRLTDGPSDCAVGTVLRTGQTCTVRAQFDPGAIGAKTAFVTFASNAPAVAVVLNGSGTQGTLEVAPGALEFGARVVGGGPSAAKTVTVSNTGDAPLDVDAPVLEGVAAFSVASNTCTTPVAPGDDCELGVVFAPAAAGTAEAQLKLTHDGAGAPVSVALSGTGTAVVVPPPPIVPRPPILPGPALATVAQFASPRLLGKQLNTGVAIVCPPNRPFRCAGSVRVTRGSIRPGRTARVEVARGTFSVDAGGLILRVRPTLAVRRLLRRIPPLALTVTVIATDAPGLSRTARFTGVLRRGDI